MQFKTIPFTEKDVKKYLDDCIVFWRTKKEREPDNRLSIYYIDAFQSMRVSLFGKLLKKGGGQHAI